MEMNWYVIFDNSGDSRTKKKKKKKKKKKFTRTFKPVINGVRADHATSLLPNPIMVWTNESTPNLRCANTKLKLRVLSLVQTTIGFATVFYDYYVC